MKAISSRLSPVIYFSLISLSLLMISRIGYLVLFGHYDDLLARTQYLDEFLISSLRFDIKLVASCILLFIWLPLYIFRWITPSRILSIYLRNIFLLLITLICFLVFLEGGYIYFYQKPIDVLIFGFLQDDTYAIVLSIFNDKLLLLLIGGFLLVSTISWRLFSDNLSIEIKPVNSLRVFANQIFWGFVSFILLVVLIRGSFDTFPLQRKHAFVSDHSFVNAIVMNSGINLYYAYKDYKVNNSQVFQQDILAEHGFSKLDELVNKAGYSDQNPLIKTSSQKPLVEKRKPHVIFLMMESMSTYIALGHSAENNVLGEFAEHSREDKFFTRFVTQGIATNPALEAMLLNSPITPLSQSVASDVSFRMSNILPFSKQGYKTVFLSGGSGAWRNHEKFWLQQGFDQYIGRSKVEHDLNLHESGNPWGIYDEYLFEYLKTMIASAEEKDEPLFSFVMTTTNHTPIRLPKSYTPSQLDPTVYGLDSSDEKVIEQLQGYHYAANQLGRFLSWLKSSPYRDDVIVVATADHPLHNFSNQSDIPQQFIHHAVPVYWYLPERLDQLANVSDQIAGSHADIFPTLYELSLSESEYFAFGQSLTEKQPDSAYGRSTANSFVFADGLVAEKTNLFYPWKKDHAYLLSTSASTIDADRKSTIEKEHYRNALKRYLLISDYKNKTGHQ